MAKKQFVPATSNSEVASKVSAAILEFVGHIPSSNEPQSSNAGEAARSKANSAATKAALAAGTFALPPGPWGWLTIIPEMLAVWKIQAQIVADIASLYGKKSTLTQEQMLYCLFRHSAAQAVRDLVIRVGERVLVKRAPLRLLQSIAQKVGVKITQRIIGKGLSRWLPIVGALGVGAYAYYDTAQVAVTAIKLFEQEIDFESEPSRDA